MDSRKIAAILAADIVEYSRLMGADEHGTLATLKSRRAIFDEQVRQFGGREFGSVGDSLMAEFPSAVNATLCALEFQKRNENENVALAPDKRLHLRIGVNLGDVIAEDDRLFGDAVNIAARLQALATPGGVLISGAVHDQVRKKLRAQFIDLGLRKFKNIDEPIRALQVQVVTGSSAEGTRRRWFSRAWIGTTAFVLFLGLAGVVYYSWNDIQPALTVARPESQTIAVLPFENLSGDPAQDYLGEGLSEELLNRLANVPGLQVSARTSSAYFKQSRPETVQTIGKMLGVRHLVEGSVRKSGDMLRVHAQLIDTKTGYHLWSQSFDKAFSDVLAIQEEISLAILKGLDVPVVDHARAEIMRHATTSPAALDLYLRARRLDHKWKAAENEQAIALYKKAISLDPNFAVAYLRLADAIAARGQAGAPSKDSEGELIEPYIRKAIELDPDSADAHARLARALLDRFNIDGMRHEMRAAEQLNPSSELALYHLTQLYAFIAWPPEKAIDYAEQWVRIDPLNSWAACNVAIAQYHAFRFDDALDTVDRVTERDPDFWVAQWIRTWLLFELDRDTDALVSAQRASELHPSADTATDLAVAYARLGDTSWARELLAKSGNREALQVIKPHHEAQVALALGDLEAALKAVERSFAEPNSFAVELLLWPDMVPLHGRPEFQKMVRQLGLERRVAYTAEYVRNRGPRSN